MKQIFIIFSIVFFTSFSLQLKAQKSCKVLVPEIDSIYQGKCKNGLANGKGEASKVDSYKGKFSEGLPHGQGTYIWANGDQYRGDWKEGKRSGEGTLTLKLDKRDSIINGLWEDDKYLGPKPIAPKIISKISIDRYTFRNTGGVKNRVLIDFLQNGARNTSISNMIITSTKGVETTLGQSIGYDYIDFPVRIRVNYQTKNKLRSQEYQAVFEFEITEPGDWLVEIHN